MDHILALGLVCCSSWAVVVGLGLLALAAVRVWDGKPLVGEEPDGGVE